MADSQNTIPKEIWKEIPGFPGYEVSNHGKVKSYFQPGTHGLNYSKPHILCPTKAAGYPRVILCKDSRRHYSRIHVLVLTTFVGPCPKGMQACHNDGTRINNFLENLRWDTLSNNQLDRRKHGTNHVNVGEKCHAAKMTDAKILEIRKMYIQKTYSLKTICTMFHIHRRTLWDIIHYRTWKHLP